MSNQNRQTTSRNLRVSQAREELTQREFDPSYDERQVEGQEDHDPGKLKDSKLLESRLKKESAEVSSSQPVSQRSGGPAEPLTEDEFLQGLKEL